MAEYRRGLFSHLSSFLKQSVDRFSKGIYINQVIPSDSDRAGEERKVAMQKNMWIWQKDSI
ncbi:hypothetical protein EPI10_024036 [Gossypium australe]|uniref:Uncharacterized protein n=1 Tax=Gossypium australe TaxID=47621 RepID=A0A5B6VXG6_9ROSI|nr:hypothetical protein EPI10_024036 [Gossypium australe]